jgi:ribosomal protein S18 acetylase RimI-like enzyme
MSVRQKTPMCFAIRESLPADIPGIMRLKFELAVSDEIPFTVRAGPADWQRDGYGPNAHFAIFVAESGGRIVGMAICAERYFPGWVGPTVALLDLCVEAKCRNRGIGTALLAQIARFAKARDSVMIELTMRAGNPAGALYERVGYVNVTDARNYVLAGNAIDRLAAYTVPLVRKTG